MTTPKTKQLIELVNRFYKDDPESFKKGQLVIWKEGLRHRHSPSYEEVAYVMEDLLKEPIISPEPHSTDSCFQERLDLVLGVIDSNGEFEIYYYDHRRFKVFQPSPEDSST